MRRSDRRARLPALLLAGLTAVSGGGLPAFAAVEFPAQPMQQARHGTLTLDQAIAMAERRFHARVVRAGVEESNGQRVYVLRLVSDQGRVWSVRVDAQTGAVF